MGRQFPGMTLELGQVVEGVGVAQLAGMDQAHEQIAHLGAVQSAKEQCIFFAVQNRPLQCPFDDVVPTPGLCRAASAGFCRLLSAFSC